LIGSGEFTQALRVVDTLLLTQRPCDGFLSCPPWSPRRGLTPSMRCWPTRDHFDRLGAWIQVAPVWTRDGAVRLAGRSQLADADLIYLAGGKDGYLADCLVDSPFAGARLEAWCSGPPLAAASAAAVLLDAAATTPKPPRRLRTAG
jgi:hypothetical protein